MSYHEIATVVKYDAYCVSKTVKGQQCNWTSLDHRGMGAAEQAAREHIEDENHDNYCHEVTIVSKTVMGRNI